MTFKPRIVKHKGFWTVVNPMGSDSKYVHSVIINRWVQAYLWCEIKNFS